MNLTSEITNRIVNSGAAPTINSRQKVYNLISEAIELSKTKQTIYLPRDSDKTIGIIDDSLDDIIRLSEDNTDKIVLDFFQGLCKTNNVKGYCTYFKINHLAKAV